MCAGLESECLCVLYNLFALLAFVCRGSAEHIVSQGSVAEVPVVLWAKWQAWGLVCPLPLRHCSGHALASGNGQTGPCDHASCSSRRRALMLQATGRYCALICLSIQMQAVYNRFCVAHTTTHSSNWRTRSASQIVFKTKFLNEWF